MNSTVTEQEMNTMQQMENNVGRRCSFVADHGILSGTIQGVSNSEHYRVQVDHASIWEWYVRSEAIQFAD